MEKLQELSEFLEVQINKLKQKMMTKVIPFNKENECKKNDGIAPDTIIYCGKIEDVNDEVLQDAQLNLSSFFDLMKDAKEDEDSCIIVRALA